MTSSAFNATRATDIDWELVREPIRKWIMASVLGVRIPSKDTSLLGFLERQVDTAQAHLTYHCYAPHSKNTDLALGEAT